MGPISVILTISNPYHIGSNPMARIIEKYPDRFAGFANLAPQAPAAARLACFSFPDRL